MQKPWNLPEQDAGLIVIIVIAYSLNAGYFLALE